MPDKMTARTPGMRALHQALRCSGLAMCLLWPGTGRAAESSGSISARPLEGRHHPRGKTMFVKLSPDQTGVVTENNFDDPRMWGDLYFEAENGPLGTGVAIGDYDGDGRPDLFVVSKTEGCHLFRNLGDYRFEDVTERAGVADHGDNAKVWKQGVTFVDINNSGRLDIYVCRFGAPNLLYINQGDGTFKECAHAYGLDVTDSSVMASFCDYDRDGFLDVYIATNLLNAKKSPAGQRGHLFHNNGNHTFTDVTDKSGISGESQSHSATWWDFDNDGWPDLYVANDFGVADKLYHNNRDGTFTDVISQVLPHTSYSSMGSDFGDLRNEGRRDFLVADMAGSTHAKNNHGGAEFREETADPFDLASAPKCRRNALMIDTGTGHFQEAAYLAGIATTDWTWAVRFEDFDNDGRLDLFVTNGFPRDQGDDTVKRVKSDPSQLIAIMSKVPPQVDTHLAFRNLGNLEFKEVGAEWGLDEKGVSFGAATGDLSGDGNLDIVYSNFRGGATVMRNDNDANHCINIDLRGTQSNRFGVGATVRVETAGGLQVHELELARGYMSSSEPMLHFGTGADTVVKRMVVTWPAGNIQTFENLAVDMRYTVTEPAVPRAPPAITVQPQGQFEDVTRERGLLFSSKEEVTDEIYLQPLIPTRFNRRGPALAVGDVFNSGRDDVVIGGTTLDRLRILHHSSSNTFSESDVGEIETGTTVDDGPILLFDAAGKGRQDLLVTKGGNSLLAGSQEYQPRLYLNDGHGGYSAAAAGALPVYLQSAGALAAADFDHSGRLGVFIGGRVLAGRYPFSPQSALWANRGGRFEDVTDSLAPGLREAGMVTGALWSDVDGDGWPDLLLAIEWGNVRYFHNNGGHGFEDWTARAGFAAAGTGWWTSIAAADFNGDGRPDYVVGNVGLNTPYRADADHPALLYSGEFKPGGPAQLIEAYYEGAKVYPRRSRMKLGGVLPSSLKKFPSYDRYSTATLEDIVGKQRLEKADRFAATELRSGVFLSQPDGTFRFDPLPRLAQIAPLQGVVAGPMEGDANAGIFAVQNSYAPIPLVGRFDGGISQLLRGDGRGHFSIVPARESGLVVTGDAKALSVIDQDGDGWPDFVVTRNNDTSVLFHNKGRPGRHSLSVSLKGREGNPTGVGARVTVEWQQGSRQSSEVYAGSGYYSQSTSSCFFGYPDGNPPKRITVLWPDGKTTEDGVDLRSASVVISEDRR